MKTIMGLTQAQDDCAVVVIADVDMVSAAYQYVQFIRSYMPVEDNPSVFLNAIEELSGSPELVSIRSRGNFERPFDYVDKIETQAEADTIKEEQALNAEIQRMENELNNELRQAKEVNAAVIQQTVLKKQQELETQIYEAKQKLRKIRKQKRESIELLGTKLKFLCMLPGPILILIVAIVIGLRRSMIRRHYISHASDS
jgi:ABC-type uncharacterized transport system involved in gliding motility auxiliary subunit